MQAAAVVHVMLLTVFGGTSSPPRPLAALLLTRWSERWKSFCTRDHDIWSKDMLDLFRTTNRAMAKMRRTDNIEPTMTPTFAPDDSMLIPTLFNAVRIFV